MMVAASGKVPEAAEKSLAVHYANYKEDIVLKKNLDILNRTEKNIVHSVKIDQKILYKRFQDKLHRSKLAYARMHGDKEKERELRAKNLRSLNVNIGDSEHDYDFLKKIQQSHDTKDNKTRKVKIKIEPIIDDVFVDDQPARLRSRSFSEGNMTPLPNSSDYAKRPSSAKYGRHEERTTCFPITSQTTEKTTDSKSSAEKGNAVNNKLLQVPPINTRPNSCSPKLHGSYSRRNSVLPQNGGDKSPRRSTNVFENEERIDFVEMRLNELKSLDYTAKIENFCETLENHKSEKNGGSDYYTMRLEASEAKDKILEDIPGTPAEQYEKHYGNLEVRSLTMKKLNFDFSKSDTSQSHLYTPDASAMLRYPSSDESDTDSD